MFVAKDLAGLIQPCNSAKVLRTPGGWAMRRQSWLLRYPETSLKNDFICCTQKKKFYNRPKHQLKALMVKLCPFASSFRCEKVLGEANGIVPMCVKSSYFLSSMCILTNSSPFFFYFCVCVWGRKYKVILFHSLIKKLF